MEAKDDIMFLLLLRLIIMMLVMFVLSLEVPFIIVFVIIRCNYVVKCTNWGKNYQKGNPLYHVHPLAQQFKMASVAFNGWLRCFMLLPFRSLFPQFEHIVAIHRVVAIWSIKKLRKTWKIWEKSGTCLICTYLCRENQFNLCMKMSY